MLFFFESGKIYECGFKILLFYFKVGLSTSCVVTTLFGKGRFRIETRHA